MLSGESFESGFGRSRRLGLSLVDDGVVTGGDDDRLVPTGVFPSCVSGFGELHSSWGADANIETGREHG